MERPVFFHQELDDVVLLLRQPPDQKIESWKGHEMPWLEWESGSSRKQLVKNAIAAEIRTKPRSAQCWNTKGRALTRARLWQAEEALSQLSQLTATP